MSFFSLGLENNNNKQQTTQLLLSETPQYTERQRKEDIEVASDRPIIILRSIRNEEKRWEATNLQAGVR